MSTSEQRQGAEIPALVPDQPRDEVSLSGLAPGLVPAILPERVDKSRVYLPGQSDPVGDGEVVYAVYAATGRAARNGKTDRRFVEENVSDELLSKERCRGRQNRNAHHVRPSPRESVLLHPKDRPQFCNCRRSRQPGVPCCLALGQQVRKSFARFYLATLDCPSQGVELFARADTMCPSRKAMFLELPMPQIRRTWRLTARKPRPFCARVSRSFLRRTAKS